MEMNSLQESYHAIIPPGESQVSPANITSKAIAG